MGRRFLLGFRKDLLGDRFGLRQLNRRGVSALTLGTGPGLLAFRRSNRHRVIVRAFSTLGVVKKHMRKE
jgi:hypothetical protein